MDDKIVVHPIQIRLRPYPPWDRVRIAIECLIFGSFDMRGEVTEVKPRT
jgi:hypothetical protein